MGRWVLLHHELPSPSPDGSWHYDWLLEDASHPEGGLITFRTRVRPDVDGIQVFDAQRLADHRRVYLTYEGEVSGGRGRVRRVAEGTCQIEVSGAVFQVVLVEPGRRWVGTRREPAADVYRFTLQE
jgi:hypothetical protein